MRVGPSSGLNWVMALALCFTTGCPQMLEDDFALAEPEAVGGSVASGGAGGSDGPAAGYGGCGSSWRRCGPGGEGWSGGPDSDIGIDPECGPDGRRGPNGDCYASVETETTWSTARASCQVRGGNWDLATIRDAEENAFVSSISGFEAWIGATDAANEGTWLWVNDGALFFDVQGIDVSGELPYTNWNEDEPNDADDSDCLRILPTGLWADWMCESTRGYVCQQHTL